MGISIEIMPKQKSQKPVHRIPTDMKAGFMAGQGVWQAWQTFTPLAKNEWICWVTSAKKAETRAKRIVVGIDKIQKGMRRPCCFEGCPHR
jgi:uncharacterized protein YdeI (YjbR/CyaY-like superfamily)